VIATAPWPPRWTQEQTDFLFMYFLEDDTKDAPWMVMGDLQFWSASGFAHSLRNYAHERELPWFVASMLPIQFAWPGLARKRVLSPDTFVAFVPEHPRSSFDAEAEGQFPPFVLEVVSPSSTTRDQEEKYTAYRMMAVQEYALFTPRDDTPSTLEGYRRDESGAFVPWLPDDDGRLWSAVLGLNLLVNGRLLQGQTPEGRLLFTPEQAEVARQRAEAEQLRVEEDLRRAMEENRQRAGAEQRRAETERQRAEEELRRAEEEIERLRRELERYRKEGSRG
jgi:Uma2 family endonuclease